MQMETNMTGHFLPDGTPSGFFAARIVIPVADFARLGLGDHERPSAAPACFRWCHETFGMGGSRWLVRLPPDAAATIYFAEREDAEAFFVRWSPTAVRDRAIVAAARGRQAATEVVHLPA